MKKTKTNILTTIIGILLGSIYLLAMAGGALAQDLSDAEIQIEVSSGCDWDGTPYASNLTVHDNDTCTLTDVHNVGAYNVYVENDADSSGDNPPLQLKGGKLVIGDGTIDTDITFGGTMTMDGILEIGVTGDPSFSSNLQIDGTSAISNTGSDGDLNIIANTNDDNTIELGSSLTIATSSTGGTFTNHDDAITNTIDSISINGTSASNRGLLENLAGTITITNQIDMYGYGKIDNDGTLTLGNTASSWNNYASADNTGTMNLSTLNFISSGTFNNTGTGDINVTGNIVLNSGGTINNDNTATVTVDTATYVYNAASNINNHSSWETDLLQIGILPTVAGGNFNNFGTLTFPAPAATSINIYNGGDLNNESTGTITVPTNIYMEGASGQISTITNDNTTTADAVTVTGEITMDDYANITNSGNLTVNGSNNIIFGADNGTPETINSTITNNSAGYIKLNGTGNAIFDEDISVTNAGTIDVAATTTLNDTASITQTAGDFNTPILALTDTTSGEATFTMSDGTVDVAISTYVYDGGTANNNVINVEGGTLTTQTIYIGYQPSTIDGGIVNIKNAGYLYANGTNTNYIYKGTLNIQANSNWPVAFRADKTLNIKGDSSEESNFNMNGTGTVELYDLNIYEYGNYYANSGITDLRSYNLTINGNNASDRGLLQIANGAEARGVNTLNMTWGEIQNNGTLWRGNSATMFVNMNNNSYIYNGAGGIIDTYTGGSINMLPESSSPYNSIYNAAGGKIDTYYFNLYTNGQEINNYGDFNLNYQGYIGISSGGGTVNNYSDFSIGNSLHVQSTGTFNNEEDAHTHGSGEIYVEGASAAYYQKEGTDAGSQTPKTEVTKITVSNGIFENADYVRTDVMDITSNGRYLGVLDGTGDPSPDPNQDSITEVFSGGGLEVASGTAASPGLHIEGNATDHATLYVTEPFDITASGAVLIDGTLEMVASGGNTLNNNGEFYSGDYSVVTLVDTPGMNTSTGSFTQFAGTLTATSINMNGGDMCLGSYSGAYPTGTCSNNALDPSKTITSITPQGYAFDVGGGANVDMYNDLTLTNGDLYINEASTFETYGTSPLLDVQNNANIIVNGTFSSLYTEGQVDVQGSGLGNHGYLKVENSGGAEIAGTTNNIGSIDMPGTAGTDSTITIDAGATVNLNDTHTSALGNSVLTIGINDLDDSDTLYNYGIINMNSGSTQNIYLGTDTTANFGLDGVVIYPDASFQHTNGSTGNLDINNSGIFAVFDDSNTDLDADINGEIYVDGHFDWGDSDQPHGLLVGGQLRCQNHLLVDTDGYVESLDNSVITVAGSTTDVYGEMELNGTLNAGDLTVYSGGLISSGDGSDFNFGEGCGPTGRFGCGISTNFYINATSLDVRSGGKISSDGVSVLDNGTSSTIAHGGSHAGEGIPASGSPDATYGSTKASTAEYGEQGEGAGTSDIFNTHGGGGVNINVTGDITIDGTVSANSGAITYDIDYGTLSGGNFEAGSNLTGSNGTAIIRKNNNAGTTGTLTIEILTGSFSNGDTLTAENNATATATSNATLNEGAGAGGTVIITQDLSAAPSTAIFTGSGTISANGGDATYPGGGGRISIDTPLLDDPDFGSYDFGEATAGTVEALGGTDGSSAYAAAGTMVYLGDTHNSDDTLIIDQGSNAPTGGTQTDLADTPTFDRIEANNSAYADLTGATTQVCYNLNSSTVSGITCNTSTSLPDKPDSLHIQTTSNGTNSADPTEEPGYIAGKGNGVSDTALAVGDITPVFAMYFRNPGDPTGDYGVAEIQVASDPGFSTLLWDATVGGADTPVTLTTPVSDGEWTEDIEYAGNTLSLSTTYYVRARFRKTTGDNPGLWTHADYNDQYKFEVSSYTDLWIDNCNGVPANTSVVLTQDGTTTGADMGNTSGQRYGYGSCDVHISTSESNWEVYGSYASGESAFTNTAHPSVIFNNINNAGSDCNIDSGGTANQEEFGYNITTYPLGTSAEQIVDANVNVDPECSTACTVDSYTGKYNQSQDANNAKNCYFDLEALATPDTILDTDTGTASGLEDGIFTVNVHAHAYQTDAGDYDTTVEVTLTSNP